MLTVYSALSCSKNVWFRSKNARFCSKFFSRFMLEIARWSLEIFLCSKCSTIFPLEIARIENSKSKIVLEIAQIENFNARNARDRCFCCSVSTIVYLHCIDFDTIYVSVFSLYVFFLKSVCHRWGSGGFGAKWKKKLLFSMSQVFRGKC